MVSEQRSNLVSIVAVHQIFCHFAEPNVVHFGLISNNQKAIQILNYFIPTRILMVIMNLFKTLPKTKNISYIRFHPENSKLYPVEVCHLRNHEHAIMASISSRFICWRILTNYSPQLASVWHPKMLKAILWENHKWIHCILQLVYILSFNNLLQHLWVWGRN